MSKHETFTVRYWSSCGRFPTGRENNAGSLKLAAEEYFASRRAGDVCTVEQIIDEGPYQHERHISQAELQAAISSAKPLSAGAIRACRALQRASH
ncbi:MAG: hypothetical protein AB7G80_07825 [Dongiaceae bacterium]